MRLGRGVGHEPRRSRTLRNPRTRCQSNSYRAVVAGTSSTWLPAPTSGAGKPLLIHGVGGATGSLLVAVERRSELDHLRAPTCATEAVTHLLVIVWQLPCAAHCGRIRSPYVIVTTGVHRPGPGRRWHLADLCGALAGRCAR